MKVIERWFLGWLLLPTISILAIEPREYAVDVTCEARSSPPALVFAWPLSIFAHQYWIRKKSVSDGSWSAPIANLPGTATGFTDTEVGVGSAYEYEIQMETDAPAYEGGWINAYSYIYGGIELPVADAKGKVLLVVDSSVAADLQTSLASFAQDLVGAGWLVARRDVDRSAAVTDVKNIIRAEYNADPATFRAIILIGRVPVPYSGDIFPDLHESHRGAWPADVYYADMDGTWTDNSVSVTSEDYRENDNYPGDGKFDQSTIPAPIRIAVGRIDFFDLPSFAPRTETDLLRNYFAKDHAFRHRLFAAPRRAVVHDNFGDLDGDAPAVDAWRHFSGFFGSGNVLEIGPDSFFPTLNSESFLWAYGCGGGGDTKADGIGSTTDFVANDPKAVFMILHGSYFGDWNRRDNFLRSAIASPSMTLVSIWSGIPHWYMHHMALGETIGYSLRVTQNNLGLYKSYRNFDPGEVHISLIGDPTLEMFPVVPPSNLTASANGTISLSWSASPDDNIVGYYVYYSQNAAGPFQRITGAPLTATTFSHQVADGTYYYMVRAIKLERSGSGSFYNASQGIIASVTQTNGPTPIGNKSPLAQGQSLVTAVDTSLQIELVGSDPEGALLHYGIKRLPSIGQLSGRPPHLGYTPNPGVRGTDSFTFTVSDGEIESAEAAVLITINARNINAVRIENGMIVFTITGPAAGTFRVESSADAKTWDQAGQGSTDQNGSAEYRDAEIGRSQFYRVAWP
jgi:hypothetical protein